MSILSKLKNNAARVYEWGANQNTKHGIAGSYLATAATGMGAIALGSAAPVVIVAGAVAAVGITTTTLASVAKSFANKYSPEILNENKCLADQMYDTPARKHQSQLATIMEKHVPEGRELEFMNGLRVIDDGRAKKKLIAMQAGEKKNSNIGPITSAIVKEHKENGCSDRFKEALQYIMEEGKKFHTTIEQNRKSGRLNYDDGLAR